jgi:hypothetical protein
MTTPSRFRLLLAPVLVALLVLKQRLAAARGTVAG